MRVAETLLELLGSSQEKVADGAHRLSRARCDLADLESLDSSQTKHFSVLGLQILKCPLETFEAFLSASVSTRGRIIRFGVAIDVKLPISRPSSCRIQKQVRGDSLKPPHRGTLSSPLESGDRTESTDIGILEDVFGIDRSGEGLSRTGANGGEEMIPEEPEQLSEGVVVALLRPLHEVLLVVCLSHRDVHVHVKRWGPRKLSRNLKKRTVQIPEPL